ncbi:PAS domain-containing sensor histidine kinase [Caulobacter sp. S45]|uniref:sensor histidine kinase NtrY-like n=1 Tax=Caulobacter sp. S45 TaxID=1641861 RepID=UPI00131BD33F|nr:PAS domain-containing sensor histidine kinase [Caulobacter sp. S45]
MSEAIAPDVEDRLDRNAALEASMRPKGAYVFGVLFILTALVTAVAVFLTVGAPATRPLAAPRSFVVFVLTANLVVILGLASIAALRVVSLFGPNAKNAGVRLHRRFVITFALSAVAPAVIMAVFFGLLINQGVETWFSNRVRTVVDNAATVTHAYIDEQQEFIRNRMGPMAEDLNRNEASFERSRLQFSGILATEVVVRDMAAVYLIDSEGRVLARAEQPSAPPFLAPPPEAIAAAAKKDEVSTPFSTDYVRGVMRLRAYPEAYLYVARPMGEGIMAQLRRSQQSVIAYRQADRYSARIQAIFLLAYVETGLLVLVGAVWVGISVATQIAAPVSRLVQAADQVASGDLSARVDTRKDPEEIAVLSRAFNRMTSDLQTQQAALTAASEDAQSRRRFIEAVLSGVSAGVVGLDAAGRVSAINARALALLGLDEAAALGRSLANAAPEMAEVMARAASSGHDAEAELDILRGADTRRLRVRVSGRSETGLVLTFDDITRLLTAQRNAAWRDVARRIAHEIKNPLTPIQLSAERIRRRYRKEITSDLDTFDRCTDTIIRQVGDIGRMVDEFSSFARMPAPKLATEDAAELLRQAVFSERVANPDVEVLSEISEGEVHLVCDGRLVAQALLNVLKNAGEAIGARVATQPEPPGRIVARLLIEPTSIVFEVEDNGLGLPNKDRDRLTEPYVTTREKGTGLGLAIVKRILEEHGGELELTDATLGRGARARLVFPALHAASAPAPFSVATV